MLVYEKKIKQNIGQLDETKELMNRILPNICNKIYNGKCEDCKKSDECVNCIVKHSECTDIVKGCIKKYTESFIKES